MARTFDLGGKQSLATTAIRPAVVGVCSRALALFELIPYKWYVSPKSVMVTEGRYHLGWSLKAKGSHLVIRGASQPYTLSQDVPP